MNIHILAWLAILLFGVSAIGITQEQEPLLGDESDGSRANFVHVIPLLDDQGIQLTLEDEPLLPFSTKQTCALKCHNYEQITSGWHFNFANTNQKPGRSGHPWIYTDARTGTQIPLSYRGWEGTFTPAEIGMSDWEFVQHFGRHLPGGSIGEWTGELEPDHVMRAMVSGPLETNCLTCHDAEASQNQAEFAEQIKKENFRWAAAAASGFADVEGSAKNVPDTYDYIMPDALPDSKIIPPTVHYKPERFDHKQNVYIDIQRKIPNERCYFCHSTIPVNGAVQEKWTADEDVHIAAGMMCVDCHRNGIGHDMVRGYEGEEEHSGNPMANVLSCEGCHLGQLQNLPTAGRMSAPVPKHKGIPPLHFEKMNCTACHSGPWMSGQTQQLKTSMAHALGTHGVNKSPQVLPHIISPVFARSEQGKTGPYHIVWQSFWGILKDEKVSPLSIKDIQNWIQMDNQPLSSGNWIPFAPDVIASTLANIQSSNTAEGELVYISGGLLYRLDSNGELLSQQHPAAEPYRWAFAHNIRPAAQSLGVRGCADCHSTDSNFFCSNVKVDTPVIHDSTPQISMIEFLNLDTSHISALNASFIWRPYTKLILILSVFILFLILLAGSARLLQIVLFESNSKPSG